MTRAPNNEHAAVLVGLKREHIFPNNLSFRHIMDAQDAAVSLPFLCETTFQVEVNKPATAESPNQ